MAPLDNPDASAAAVDGVAPTLLHRMQDFVSEHKKAIVIAAAAAAVAGGLGVAYYASTSSSKPPRDSSSDTSGKKKKKTGSRGAKKGGKDKEKRVGSADGPILEERKPKAPTVEDTSEWLFHAKDSTLTWFIES